MRYALPIVMIVAILSGCSLGSGRVRSSDYPFDFKVNCLVDGRHVILMLIDGCRPDLFNEMVQAGELPAIKKYFVDCGSSSTCTLSTVPSITTAAVAAIVCGAYPGHIDIIGNRWFDRERLRRVEDLSVNNFYAPNEYIKRKTIFEILGDEMTVNVCNRSCRGSTYNISIYYNLIGMRNCMLNNLAKLDEIFVEEFGDVVECANREGVFPRLTFIHLPGLDQVAHRHGSAFREAREHLKKIDMSIGELMEALARNGILDNVCRIVVADHGHTPLKKENYILLGKCFSNEFDLPVLEHESCVDRCTSKEARERYYRKFSMIVANNGRNASLYARHNPTGRWVPPEQMGAWEKQPPWEELRRYQTPHGTVDLVDVLRRMRGIGYVIGRPKEDEIALFTATGEGRIRRKGVGPKALFAYEVLDGEDPLGYRETQGASALMDGGFHSSRDWLSATCSASRPDIVAQLPSLFDSLYAGDLFIVAADGWDFEKANVSGHGGFLKDEMLVPLVVAGPRIRKGTFGPVRTVDVAPTILDYLGYAEAGMDGVSFLGEIEEKR